MYVSDSCVSVITNLQEAVNFLRMELVEAGLYSDFEAKIRDFLYTNKDLDCKLVQTQRDLVYALYVECLGTLLESAASRDKTGSRQYQWNVRVSLETYILYALRHVLLKSLSASTAAEDANLNKIVRNLGDVELNDLRVHSDLQSRVHGGRSELSRLDCLVTVLGKIECLRRTVNYVSRGASSVVSSDDLLPMLIFLVIKVGLPNWTAQLAFMRQFRFSARSVRDADESDFLITSLEAAIEHIRSGAIARERSAYLASPRESTEHRPSVERLFACIERGDLSEVERILAYDESNQLDDVELCHPLCTCASCERSWTKQRELNNAYPKDDRGRALLHVAVLYEQTAIVDFLLEHETDVNIADLDGLTALHYACARGHQGILLRLLHANANPTLTDPAGDTPLHVAADRGHESCAKALLYLSEQMKVSVDANATNCNGDTALHLAAKWGYGTIVRVLLECGANCKPINRKGQTPLVMTYNKYVAELLEYYAMANLTAGGVSDDLSARQSTPKDQIAKPYSVDDYTDVRQQRTVDRLLAAIVEGDTCLACYYLGLEVYRGRSSSDTADGGLCHPLCDCERCSAIGESLSEHRKRGRRVLPINACNGHGETALHVASTTGRTEMVRLLLDAGANVNVTSAPETRTPLHLACGNDNVEVARLLLNCATCNVDARDRDGNTPLHLTTATGNSRLVGLLVRHGADTDARNQRNLTPLQLLELETPNDFSASYANVLKILRRNSTLHSAAGDD